MLSECGYNRLQNYHNIKNIRERKLFQDDRAGNKVFFKEIYTKIVTTWHKLKKREQEFHIAVSPKAYADMQIVIRNLTTT